MGSQYIGGTTDLKTRNKKQKVYPDKILRNLPVFYADLWGIYKRERKFSTGFYTISTIEEVDG